MTPTSAAEPMPTDLGTPVRVEATDDLNEEEIPPQPFAVVQPPWCLQQIVEGREHYDARIFNLFATLSTNNVDRWANYLLILRGKQGARSTPVTVFKTNHVLGPGEFNDFVSFLPDDIRVPYVVGYDGVAYERVRLVVKLVRPGKNPVLSDTSWFDVATEFWSPTCARQYLSVPATG